MPTTGRSRTLIVTGLLVACVIAASSAWLASGDPDGLERVAEDQQFIDKAQEPGYEVLPDYTVPGVDGALSTVFAGLIGVGVVAGLTLGAGYLLRSRGRAGESVEGDPTELQPGGAGER